MTTHLTLATTKKIKAAALRYAMDAQIEGREFAVADTLYDAATALCQAQEQAARQATSIEHDMQAALNNLAERGVLGNSCGVLQNAHTLDILNGTIEALQQVVWSLAKALKISF